MLEPSAFPAELIPSSFLPHLPRAQTTLHPLSINDILAHIAVLRTLYLPPIHGGFHESDQGEGHTVKISNNARDMKSARRFSSGLSESMEGLGLTTGDDPASEIDHNRTATAIAEALPDADEECGTGSEASEEENGPSAHLDPFEREWAEKWLNGVVRRSQGWLEEHEDSEGQASDEEMRHKDIEAVLREATAVLAMMAGTSAAGSLTRHLLFPIDPALSPALRTMISLPTNPDLSPETTTFIKSLSMSPVSPTNGFLHRSNASYSPEQAIRSFRRRLSSTVRSDLSTSPESGIRRRRRRKPAVPVLLHDAPMADHLSVGVQTWGSAILLGRQMALRPTDFGLFVDGPKGVRILELGAGTGLLSILCRKILDLHSYGIDEEQDTARGLVVATDFHPDVLANLKICVDLNFPPLVTETIESSTDTSPVSGIHIAKLDWTSFPAFMENGAGEEEMERFVHEPFDLVLASDCVYDPTHAEMLRQVAGWVLRLPDPNIKGDMGGTMVSDM
ncbi:hypothetical protein BCR39DRAFT_546528 [Naematelia encephala]|uniref:Methyltransferase-domain-containing protein n=1 Tax=Naematelia encephala TaxID=71784 RepID=A0A1Y2APV1_9TREE|nr:hypothetical protein BCR39DRAFT_546528 [Naematelia encephala]